MRLTSAIYRMLMMMRHPEAIGLARRGIDYQQFRDLSRPWLVAMGIRTVLDVGANTGQFARLVHAVLPRARIYSFEPLPECFEQLRGALPPQVDFHPMNCGLGDISGVREIRRCIHSPSSSFLPMTAQHFESFPESKGGEVGQVRVMVRRLDELWEEVKLEGPVLLKIDVQGYEDRVLAGGMKTLERVQVVLLETSFLRFYEGQPLFHDLYALLVSSGFIYGGNLQQQYHPVDGRVTIADSLFVRAAA